jgi:phosphoglycolate phosphatase
MSRKWSHVRGVLFDKDGTLLDYARTWIPINHEVALAAARGDRALADTLLIAGGHDPKSDHVTPGSALAAAGADGIAACFAKVLGARTPPQLEATIKQIFADGGGRTAVLIEGVATAVEAMKAHGVVVGLATNDSVGGMHASLKRVGMLETFSFLVAADSGHGAKPGPGMALAFAHASGIAPEHLAAVGDATHDLEMAKQAGYGLKIAVLSGTGTHADLSPHADVVLQSVCDLPALLAVNL